MQPLLACMLAALGLMTVFSAHADWGRQVLWVVLGACAYAAAASFDYRRLRSLAIGMYAGMILILPASIRERSRRSVVNFVSRST